MVKFHFSYLQAGMKLTRSNPFRPYLIEKNNR